MKSSDIATIVYCVYYDHPELFWVDSSLTYYMNGSGIVTSLTVNFNGTANELQNAQYYFEKTIAPLINLAASLPEDFQKVKPVHDYLTNTIQYVGAARTTRALTARLYSEKASARARRTLGICFSSAASTTRPPRKSSDYIYYNYFNITDAQVSKDHTRDSLSAQLPIANGTRYSFNAYFGGNQYGSDFTGLDYSATMPSDYNSVPS